MKKMGKKIGFFLGMFGLFTVMTLSVQSWTTYVDSPHIMENAKLFEVCEDDVLTCEALSIKVFLAGPFNGTDMDDNLRVDSLIPLIEPYTGLGFTHTGEAGGGTETTDQMIIDDNNIVDWVFIELRAADTVTVVHTLSALLSSDGTVLTSSGFDLQFCNIMTGGSTYFVAVRHRNHLGVLATAQATLGSSSVDFTVPGTATYGLNAQREVEAGVWAMWSGDANGDMKTVYVGPTSDVGPISLIVILDPSNVTFSRLYEVLGYENADLNLDGKVVYVGPASDVGYVSLPVILHPANGSFSRLYEIIEQLP